MPSVYALATDVNDSSSRALSYGLVTDGQRVEIVLPEQDEEAAPEGQGIRSMRAAFNSRLGAAEGSKDLDEFVGNMFYNFPVEVSISDDYDTYEEAANELREIFASYDDISPENVNFYTPEPDGDEDDEEE